MENKELLDVGCFISQMNELLLIDPSYMNYSLTHYFNTLISDNTQLRPHQSLNGTYFPNAKPGLWFSFALREKPKGENSNQGEEARADNSYDDQQNEMVISLICMNDTDLKPELITLESMNELNWETYEPNKNHIGYSKASSNNKDNTNTETEKEVPKENNAIDIHRYFSNIATVESGQIGLFCVESIRKTSATILEETANNGINTKDQLDQVFNKNQSYLHSWYDRICQMTVNSSIGIIDHMNRPIGCVCTTNTFSVTNFLCQVVKDEVTGEVWAIRVNFLEPFK